MFTLTYDILWKDHTILKGKGIEQKAGKFAYSGRELVSPRVSHTPRKGGQ